MVKRFQEEEQAPPVFILSLKAGGTGLNLTRASHVFHFDRWWNPAVEDQATDRAYRIGQRKGVQVHAFVTTGTLEERIAEMIEDKRALAGEVTPAASRAVGATPGRVRCCRSTSSPAPSSRRCKARAARPTASPSASHPSRTRPRRA